MSENLKGNLFINRPKLAIVISFAILLAGLNAEGNTTVIEPSLSRNHTELMLRNRPDVFQFDKKDYQYFLMLIC